MLTPCSDRSKDILFNPDLLIPPRPTISNLQWISGTQYVTPEDMDLLSKSLPFPPLCTYPFNNPCPVGGPDRPVSARQLAQQRAEAQQEHRRANPSSSAVAAQYSSYPTQANTPTEEGWGAWATRQLNERTEKLNIVGDSMDNLSQNSAGWADDVNKFVGKQKRGLVMGAMKSKFGF